MTGATYLANRDADTIKAMQRQRSFFKATSVEQQINKRERFKNLINKVLKSAK